MLSDAEVEEIHQGLWSGLRGPVLVKWCRQLVADRDKLGARLQDMLATRSQAAQQLKRRIRPPGRLTTCLQYPSRPPPGRTP